MVGLSIVILIFRGVTELFFFVPFGPLVSPPQAVINGRMYQSTVTGSNSGGVDNGDVSRVFGCAGIVFWTHVIFIYVYVYIIYAKKSHIYTCIIIM